MNDQPITTEYYTKISDQLAHDLEEGILTFDEYGLLIYMLQKADKKTGIIITNSRTLSIAVNVDRKRVSNLLSSLKKKDHRQNLDRVKTEFRQKQGNTKPYAIRLNDHIAYLEKDRVKTELRQSLDRPKTLGPDRRNPEESPEAALPLTKTESGKFLALKKEYYKEGTQNESFEQEGDKEEFFWTMMDKAAPSFQQTTSQINEFQREIINEILEFPKDKIETVITKAGREGIHPTKILDWIQRGLVNYDKWYNNKTQDQNRETDFSYLSFDEDKVAIKHVIETYNGFKDMTLPTWWFMTEAEVPFKLKIAIENMQRYDATSFPFTLADIQALLKRWEEKQS